MHTHKPKSFKAEKTWGYKPLLVFTKLDDLCSNFKLLLSGGFPVKNGPFLEIFITYLAM